MTHLVWPLLAVIGYCGFLWACFGLRWPSLATVGLRWPASAFVGLCRPSLAIVGCCVTKIKNKFCTLKNDAPSMAQTMRLVLFGPALAFVGRHWLLWVFMGLRWPSLTVIGYCGFLWACVGLRWPLLAAV
jgi:hypothetical protein